MREFPTHSFKLPSGVECEVRELTGKHQRLLTEQNSKTHAEKLTEMLSDVIVRVGSKTDIDVKFIEQMLSCDKKQALVQVRQFTLGHQEKFTFTYKYVDSNGEKQEYPVDVNLEDGQFPIKPMQVEREVELEDGTKELKLVDADFEEYDEVLSAKKVTLTLPRSGQEVIFTLLDGKGELIGNKTKKSERSSHTIIKMRQPVYLHKKEGGKEAVPIQLNLDTLPYLDIEELRKTIKEREGNVDTELMFEHPEAETKSASEKDVVLDVLGTVAFFFPSEAL